VEAFPQLSTSQGERWDRVPVWELLEALVQNTEYLSTVFVESEQAVPVAQVAVEESELQGWRMTWQAMQRVRRVRQADRLEMVAAQEVEILLQALALEPVLGLAGA
jgi:hypothetical protein